MSIRVQDLYFSYGTHQVLKGIDFQAGYGQLLSVLGPNGVGKSTLFRCMLGIVPPTGGDTLIEDSSIRKMTARQLAQKIAYIPQSHNPVFNFSVFDMVLMGTTAQLGGFSSPKKEQEELVESALSRLGIAHLRHRGYANISGGERQLTLIARAIAQKARVLVMDEPSASLDFGNRIRLMQIVRKLTEEGYCIIQSTHDPDQAYLYSDQVLALYEGRILAFGSPKETICDSLVSTLYGVKTKVCSMADDTVRVCIPAENIKEEKEFLS